MDKVLDSVVDGLIAGLVTGFVLWLISVLVPGLGINAAFWGVVVGVAYGLYTYVKRRRAI